MNIKLENMKTLIPHLRDILLKTKRTVDLTNKTKKVRYIGFIRSSTMFEKYVGRL